jgi:hypothetical protein
VPTMYPGQARVAVSDCRVRWRKSRSERVGWASPFAKSLSGCVPGPPKHVTRFGPSRSRDLTLSKWMFS